jgi:hypothetical protein
MQSLESLWIEAEHAAHHMAEALSTWTDPEKLRALERHFDEVLVAWRLAAREPR